MIKRHEIFFFRFFLKTLLEIPFRKVKEKDLQGK